MSKEHGGRLIRSWARQFEKDGTLPTSMRGLFLHRILHSRSDIEAYCTGKHSKVFTLLNEEHISAAMRLYLRSNKWSMDPSKLQAYVENTMLPDVRDEYCQEMTMDAMPKALCEYLELQLFPRIGVRVKKPISIRTARRWMRKEGFAYVRCSKGVYIDGHERGDVVEYQLSVFLPKMLELRPIIREYEVGNVTNEVQKDRGRHRSVVTVFHDESTFTANDAKDTTWVLNNEHKLRKKGAGRGIHRSDFICSTVGWLQDAGVSMEYGKAHEGYWTGQLLCQQVSNTCGLSIVTRLIYCCSFERKLSLNSRGAIPTVKGFLFSTIHPATPHTLPVLCGWLI
jgi:hypothetical protein